MALWPIIKLKLMKSIYKMKIRYFQTSFFLCLCLALLSRQNICQPGQSYNGQCQPCQGGCYCTGDGTEQYCPTGTYCESNSAGSISDCISCPPTQTTSGPAQPTRNSCGCPKGSQLSPSDGVTCVACTPGYANSVWASNCTLCASGYYSDTSNATTCTQCPGGAYSPAGSSSVNMCNNCTAGTYYVNPDCLPCPVGQYSPQYSSSCINCSLGFYAPNTNTANCTAAPAGSYIDSTGATSYTNCLAGTYNPNTNATNSSFCVACSAGTFSGSAGLSACQSCSAGYYSNSGATQCTICPIGNYSTGAAPNCTGCPAGTYGAIQGITSVNGCQPCATGSFSVIGSSICQLCPVGTYAALTGSISCTQCPAGQYNNNTGGTSLSACTNCPLGSYSAAGASTCTPCSAGYYADSTGLTQCIACPAGTNNPNTGGTSLSVCQNCTGGTSSVAGSSSCSVCPAGQYAPAGSGVCINCAIGYFSAASNTVTCTIAQAGAYVDTAGSAVNTSCPIGTANPNTGGTSLSACVACAAGTYADTLGTVTCKLCNSGTSNSATGSNSVSACIACSAGYYAPTSGLTTCTQCPTGTYADSTGFVTCTNCSAGTSSSVTGATSSSTCQNCAVGYYSSAGSSTCTQCPVGTYADAVKTAQCTSCSAGTANPNIGATASSACACCSAGMFAIAGSATCSQCSVGQYSPSCSGVCTNCSLGYYAPNPNSASCTVAPTGTYVDKTGASAYIQCPIGTANSNTMSTSLSNCIPCSIGYYSNSLGTITCTPCAVGNYQNLTGQSACTPCPARYFQNQTTQTSCIICPAGSYQIQTGQSTCNLCQPGTKQNKTGQITCEVCPSGTYQSLSGQTSCINCSAGYYQNYPGQPSCSMCQAGTYSPYNGSSTCLQCPAGSYQTFNGRSACNLCFAGSYQDQVAQATCKLCPPGTYQTKIGSNSSCINCSAGTVNPTWGGSYIYSCHQCLNGSYQNLPGQADCINCSKAFCGPCQLADRTLCAQLNGICWIDYTNNTISNPFTTTDCLKAMAPICYNIWTTTNVSNSQCTDFTSFLDFTQMQIKVKLLSAILTSDGQYIILTFDKPIYTNNFIDCSTAFSQDTLNWLPASKSCTWTNSTVLSVSFSPDQGIPNNITIMPGNFSYNYIYCQQSADKTTINVTLPPPKMTVVIAGLTTISECDNLELLANLAGPSLYPLIYAWSISFIVTGSLMSSQDIATANEYFQIYNNFSVLRPVSIPITYYRKDCVINVTLLATAATQDSDTVSQTVIVNIVGDIPKIKFGSKSQEVSELPGDQKSILSLQIANKRCQRDNSSRRLQSDDNNLIPISVNFQIFSGTSVKLMIRGPSEKILETAFNQMYNQYHTLSMDKVAGFQYGLYYKILSTIINMESNLKNNDTFTFLFTKPTLKSIIQPLGSIVSINQNIILNGANSTFPDAKGEAMGYKWACLSCTALTSAGPCSCPIFSRSSTFMPRLVLQKDYLQNLCKYVFSLTISSAGFGSPRTDSSQIQFYTFKAPIRPVTGRIIPGSNNKIKDEYFTFQLSYSGPDTNLTYNWTLVAIQSFNPNSVAYYSEKNAYISQFLRMLGVNQTIIPDGQDIPIPDNLMPTQLTPSNVRFLGIDKSTLIPQYQYTYAVVVNYPDFPSFVWVNFLVPRTPRQRLLSISPATGVGFSTVFSIVYLLPQITDIDQGKYQIYYRSCPSQNASAKSLTQVMGQSNLFTTTLSPGDAKCKNQVEIILRSIEFGDFIENSVIATITTPPTPSSQIISTQLNVMATNNASMTVDQTISGLSSLTMVNQTEATADTRKSVDTMLKMVSVIDAPKGGPMSLYSSTDKPQLLNTTTSILANMATNQAATINITAAGNISSKATSYLNTLKTTDGVTCMVPTIVNSLSGVANIGKTNAASPSFYDNHQQALGNMTGMKLNETQPGAPPYSVSSPAVELTVQKEYLASFNVSQNATTIKGSALQLPAGLQDQLQADIEKVSGPTNNTLNLGTGVNALGYNPFANVKQNSIINVSSFSNTSSMSVSPSIISDIYNDLSKAKLKGVVDVKAQDTDIIQASFTPTEIQKDSTETPKGNNLIISSFPPQKKAYFSFPSELKNDSYNSVNNSLMTPLFYQPANKTWTNDGCEVVNADFDNLITVDCDHAGMPVIKAGKIQNVTVAISIIVDIIGDIVAVLRAGNYQALYNFSAFLTAPATNYIVLVVVFIFLAIAATIVLRLKKVDIKVLYNERIRTLYSRYGLKYGEKKPTIIKDVYEFLSNIKLKGSKKTMKLLQNKGKEQPQTEKDIYQKKITEKVEYQTNGFNKLSWMEEKELKDLYNFYHESTYLFSFKELYAHFYGPILENKVLTRLTQARLEDIILEDPTCCTVLKVRSIK